MRAERSLRRANHHSAARRSGRAGIRGHTSLILIAILWPLCTAAADLAPWYRIEVVLFAHNEPVDREEELGQAVRRYPAQMLVIAAKDGAAPMNVGQIRQVQEYETRFPGSRTRAAPTSAVGPSTATASRASEPPKVASEDATGSVPGEPSAAIAEPLTVDQILFDPEFPPFAAIDSETLAQAAAAIRRSPRYRMLYHQAWVQPIVGPKRAMPVLIQAGRDARDGYELEGTLTFSRSRLLQLDTALWWRMPVVSGHSTEPPTAPAYIPIALSRRTRSSDLNYVDHPVIGVLFQIDPVTRPFIPSSATATAQAKD